LQTQGLAKGDVILIGHSEGAVVAAGIAELLPEISHIAFLSSNGPTQMFDFMVLKRKEMRAQGRSPEAVEAEVAELESSYRKVLNDPQNTEKHFMGHSHLRWSSYFLHPALDSLLRSKAKLYLVHGTEDESVSVESFDMLAAELLRRGRDSVTVRRLAGAGHNLKKSNAKNIGPPLQPIFQDVLEWARQAGPEPG
jgi:pimeloyl-ACP methyl ester carboxylesterase